MTPIAVQESRYEELQEAPCGTEFFIWHGDNPNQAPVCSGEDACVCDVNGDGVQDILGLVDGEDIEGRAWIDFSDAQDPEYPAEGKCPTTGCGADEMRDCILYGSNSRIVIPPGGICLPGLNGVRASMKDPINSRIGDPMSFPIYDYSGCGTASCPGGGSYHVVGFGCLTIIEPGWDPGFWLYDEDGEGCWKGTMIHAAIPCGPVCETNCGGTGGGPPDPYGVRAVSMIR